MTNYPTASGTGLKSFAFHAMCKVIGGLAAVHMTIARGHSKPRMWATYGRDHKGVCLIFDRERLGRAFANGLNGDGLLLQGAVRYGDKLPANEDGAAIIDLTAFEDNLEAAMQQKIEKHHRTYFLYKHADWSTEDEYRFIISGGDTGPVELPFEDALIGVAVGMKSMEDPDRQVAVGAAAQAMEIPCMYLGWGWKSAGYAPVSEAAKHLPPRTTVYDPA